ncbi:calcium-binding protein [Nostoc sp.]|uniref:calcium-binding protein n=1 Tax=Nostoc sp. TaxID=1180 RepID=UPI002FF8878D
MATITGTFGDDVLLGTASNDRIIGSAGNDFILSGGGIDIVDYSNLGQAVSIGIKGEISKGSLGTDKVEQVETILGAIDRANSINASSSLPGISIIANLSDNKLVVSGIPNSQSLTFNVGRFVNVIGTSGNDTITGDSQNNNLQGGNGNDTFFGSAGNDTILGGAGIDIADYSNLGQAVSVGIAGAIQKGSLGTDTVRNVETIIGATGQSNIIDGSTALSNISIAADLSQNTVIVSGIANSEPLTFNVENFINVIGTSGNDTIIGNDLSNFLQGGKGNDIINGNDGSDVLIGGAGNDFIDGGDGNDGALGGAGNDNLIGGFGNDVFDGGAGNDTVTGGGNLDVLTGGAGFDLFPYFSPTEGGDLILDFTPGKDQIGISASGFGLGLSVGSLPASSFVLGTSALDANSLFIYNDKTGQLFFDQDGSGSSAQQLLATLITVPTLNANSIVVI